MKTPAADIWAVILAAGQGSRLAKAGIKTKKQFLSFQGKPLFWRSARTFASVAAMRGLVFVFPPAEFEAMRDAVRELDREADLGLPLRFATGGERRQDSVRNALGLLPEECGFVLVHDAARPFASAAMTLAVVQALQQGAQGAVPAVPVKDTIKQVAGGMVAATLKRSELAAVQTPQGFVRATLEKAHGLALEQGWDVTDDASMLEAMGEKVAVTPGEETNVKITTIEDLEHLKKTGPALPRTGFGYDVHAFGPGRPMKLGGEPIPGGPEVVAHSDGDVLLHALADALLGLAGAGDIGLHFPDTAEHTDNMESGLIVRQALDMAEQAGVRLVHADLTVIAQIPKLAPHRERIRKNIAGLLQLPIEAVNVKATTEEKLGFTGRKQGIKAVAVATGIVEDRGELL